MKRDIYQNLLTWKKDPRRKPLVLKGARQVGKTFVLKDFGCTEYADLAYFNFEEDPELSGFFSGRLDPKSIVQTLSIYREKEISSDRTLIVFDEVQSSPRVLTCLKYFCELAPQYHVIAAGSLLGIKIGQSAPFPVGKVDFLDLYPMSFAEFLDAVGKSQLRILLETCEFAPLATAFHRELTRLLRLYYFVGGMPEAVSQYVQTDNLEVVRQVQNSILVAYEFDFSKHTTRTEAMRIAGTWESIPTQLAKKKKTFSYANVAKNARAREYGESIQWLSDAGLIIRVNNIATPRLPLTSYQEGPFKLYLLDVGLLGAMTKLSQRMIVSGNVLFTEFNGAFVENFVAQELLANGQKQLFYWTSKHQAEVDFVVQIGEHVFPLEVKAGISKQKKSLRVYGDKYKPPVLSRSTLMNFKEDGHVRNYPLYALWQFLPRTRELSNSGTPTKHSH